VKSVLICTPGRCGTHWVSAVCEGALGLYKLPTYLWPDTDCLEREAKEPGRWLYLTHGPIQSWEPAWPLLNIICVVRHPMDVVVSAAYYRTMRRYTTEDRSVHKAYWGEDTDEHTTFQELLERTKIKGHNPAWWEGYLENHEKVRHSVIRYEDLHQDPVKAFSRVFDEMDCPVFDEVISWAVEKQMERAFPEGRGKMDVSKFYRRGIVGEWKEHYTDEEAAEFVRIHQEEMRIFGYL